MFELFGPFARPAPSPLPALLAAWPLLVALAVLFAPTSRRRPAPETARRTLVAGAAIGALAAAGALVVLLARPPESRLFLSPLGVAGRVGQLELTLALVLEPATALLALAAFVATGLLAWRGRTAAIAGTGAAAATFGTRRRAAIASLTLAAVLVVVMGDGAATLVLGGSLASLGAGALGRWSGAGFALDRVADGALVAATCIAFWVLGGSWIDGAYVPDLEPRLVIASAGDGAGHTAANLFHDDDDDDDRPAPAAGGAAGAHGPASQGSLSLGSLPGAAVMVDGTWLRAGAGPALLRAPFAGAPIPAGPHTLRVHVGPGSDDYYIPRAAVSPGEALALTLQGSTTTFREITGQLDAHDAAGAHVARAALERRTLAPGVGAVSVALALAVLAAMARARRHPLVGLVALVTVWRFGVFASLAPATTSSAVAVLFVVAAACAAFAARDGRRGAHAWTATELAFAGAGILAGAPAAALAHGMLATVAGTRTPSRGVHLALFFTRAAILGACGSLLHGSALVVALGLGATLLTSAVPSAPPALAPVRARTWWIAGAAGAVLAVDPRTFGRPLPSILDQALGTKSVLPPSLALLVLLAAVTAFGVATSRRLAPRLAASQPALARAITVPAFAASGMLLAAASAVTELDARFVEGSVHVGEAMLRGVGWLTGRLDDALVARTALHLPIPSARVTRVALLALALLTFAAFALPWLA